MYSSLALFILIIIPSVCKGLHNSNCNVVPKDKYIEVGSDTEIVCQTSCVYGKIFWTLNSIRVDESLSNTINSSHTVLSLRNFTYPKATLECHTSDTERILGGAIIRSYSRPRNISCMLYYSNQNRSGIPDRFRCNWEHQIDSSFSQKKGNINYTVLSKSSSAQNWNEICNSHETTCISNFLGIGDKIPLVNNFNVTVRAKTAAWETFSDTYEFDPLKILQITSPKLDVTTISDCISVEWKIRTPIKQKHDCQVRYRKAVNEETPETLVNTEKLEMTIEKVDSCSNYTFAARCALKEAPWSDWSLERTVLTKLKRSDVRLRLWRKVAEAEKNGIRKVHAMWTEIPSTCQETFTYTIKQTPYKDLMTEVNHTEPLCGSSMCDVDVNQEAHRINLTAFHNEFFSVEDSVYVPAINESLPQVTNIQNSTRGGVILVSWKAPLQPVRGYMIDYTHNGNQYYWKETKYTNATLFDLLDKKPYNITVTPLFDDKTGHGKTAHQICSRVGEPGNVTIVSVQAKDKSAVVSWTVKSQEACSGHIVNYTIFYSTQEGPQHNVTVDNTMQDFVLKDLNPETQYSVYVKATALTGATQSDKRIFTSKRFDPRLVMALSICGSVLIILVLSLGLCCAVQWKKFKEKPVPNPGRSSLAWWPSTSDKKGICSFQPFLNPTESPCDRVYTEKAQRMSVSPLASRYNDNPASDHTEEYVDPATVSDIHIQKQDPIELAGTQNSSSPEECTELLPSGSVLSSPYRSQTSVETPAPRAVKQCKRASVKQQEKMPPVTVYVTLDMFE